MIVLRWLFLLWSVWPGCLVWWINQHGVTARVILFHFLGSDLLPFELKHKLSPLKTLIIASIKSQKKKYSVTKLIGFNKKRLGFNIFILIFGCHAHKFKFLFKRIQKITNEFYDYPHRLCLLNSQHNLNDIWYFKCLFYYRSLHVVNYVTDGLVKKWSCAFIRRTETKQHDNHLCTV